MKKAIFVIFLDLLFAAALSADAMSVNVSAEPEGTNCAAGGVKIDILDGDTVVDTQYVCNGANGSSPAVSVSEEASGGMCGTAGGIKVTVGTETRYVCNGEPGKDALSRTSAEDAGANCENGGVKIEVGIDSNGNGTLEDGEVNGAHTVYSCNGADGEAGHDALAKVSDEPKGNNCKNGDGIKIEMGIDENDNGTLDAGEVASTQYVCNGKNGASQGAQGPKGDQGEPGTNGNDGKDGEPGEKGEQGPKGDQGEQGETGATGESGSNGATTLVAVSEEPKGENCASGGKKSETGLDVNGDGALGEDEVDPENIYYVCNGMDAEEAGLTSSSTGCSMTEADDDHGWIAAAFAMIAVLAAAVIKFARR